MKTFIRIFSVTVIVIALFFAINSFFGKDKEREDDDLATNSTTETASENIAAEATTFEEAEKMSEPSTNLQTQATSRSTYTGRFPLQTVKFTVSDPDNERGLATDRKDHSFGIAKNEQPNSISVSSQSFFESKGYNAVTYDSKTTEKVLYLTFDCGYENGNTEKILDTLKEKNVPAAFFCTLYHIECEPELIARMINEGHIVGNHSDTHPDFSSISRNRMATEIEAVDSYLRSEFGYTSPYFRFPEGAYSECALELVGSIGYKSVFWSCAYADWDTQNQKGANYARETVISRIHPGAVILLHSVSPDNTAAMGSIIDEARAMGYEFRSLDEMTR